MKKLLLTFTVLWLSLVGFAQTFYVTGPNYLCPNKPEKYIVVTNNTVATATGFQWYFEETNGGQNTFALPSWLNTTSINVDLNTFNLGQTFWTQDQTYGDIASLICYADAPFFAQTYISIIKGVANQYINSGAIGIATVTEKTICYNTLPGTISFSTAPTKVSPPYGSTPFTYKWYMSENNGLTWKPSKSSGAETTATITPAAITTSTWYMCLVESNFDGKWTNVVKVNVTPNFSVGQVGIGGTSATSQNICYNTVPGILGNYVAPTGSGSYTYQWQIFNSGTSTWNNITGATSATYQPTALTASTTYRRSVTDVTCGSTGYNNSVTINVYNQLTSGTINGTQTICNSTTPAQLLNATLPTGGSLAYTYSWEKSTDGTNFTTIAGATSESYTPAALAATTYFRRKVTDACGSLYSNVVLVTVRGSLTSGSIGNPQTVCYGVAPALLNTVTATTGGSGTYSYAWESSTNGSTGWTAIVGATSESYQPGTLTASIYYRRKVTDECDILYTAPIMITVRNNFVVGTLGNAQTICYGTTPTAIGNLVAPTGGEGTYSYIWENSSDGTNFNVMTGVTNATYQPGALTASIYYRRKVTDICSNAYNPSVKITVLNNFSPGSLKSDQTICNNTAPTAIVSDVVASGGTGTYTYQWESSANNSTWTTIVGANSETFSPGLLTATTYYRRKVTDACSNSYTTSVKITVLNTFLAGTIKSDQNICYNSVPFALVTDVATSGGSDSYTYQWEKSTDGTNFTSIPGAIFETYTPTALTVSTYFKRKTIDACGNGYSNTVTVTVRTAFAVGVIEGTQTSCYGALPTALGFSALPTGGAASYAYQWEISSDGTNFSSILNATSNSYQPLAISNKKFFRVNVVNACGTAKTNTVAIDVYGQLTASVIGSDQTICYGATPAALTVTTAATGGVGTYATQWESSTDGVQFSTVVGATSTTYQPGALTATRYFRQVVTDGQCGQITSNTAKIEVKNQLQPGSVTGTQAICYGSAPSTLITNTYPLGGVGSYSYQWQQLNGINWENISGAVAESYAPAALTATTYFRRAETSGSCGTVYTPSVTVTVYSEFKPGVIGSDQTIGYGATPAELTTIQAASGGGTSFTYQWQKSVDKDVWINISGATAQNYQPGALTITTFYRRITTSASCGNLITNAVAVNQELSAGIVGLAQTICYNTVPLPLNTTVAAHGGTGNYAYSWEISLDGLSNWTAISGANTESYQPSAITETTYYRRKIVDVFGALYTAPVKITVRNQFSTGVIGSAQTVCFNKVPVALGFTTVPSGGTETYTYQWQVSENGTDFSNIVFATSVSHQPAAATVNKTYRLSVTDACATGITNTTTINVRNEFKAPVIGVDQVICYNANPAEITTITPSNGASGTYSYDWEISENGTTWNSVIGATSTTYQPGALTATRYFRQVVTDSQCGKITSNSVKVEVRNQLQSGSVTGTQAICYGSAPSTLITNTYPLGGVGSYSYQWQQLNGINWENISGAVAESYAPAALTATTYFRRAETSGSCGTVYTPSVTVTVYSEFKPGVIGSDQLIGFGSTPAELTTIQAPSGGGTSFTYQWRKSVDKDVWVNITGSNTQNFQPASITQTTYYQRLTTSGNCGSALTNIVTVTVTSGLIPGTIASNQTICSGIIPAKLVGTLPSGGNSAYSFQWQVSPDGQTWSDILSTGNDKDFLSEALSQDCYFRRKVTSGQEVGYSNVIKVSILAIPNEPVVNTKAAYCLNSNVELVVDGNTPDNSYTWYNAINEFLQTGSTFNINKLKENKKLFVQVKNQNNCSSTRKEVNVTVDRVKAWFSVAPSVVTVGDVVEFTNESTLANTYKWDFYDGDPSTDVNARHYYNRLVNEAVTKYDVTLVATSQNSCKDTLTLKEAVTVNPETNGISDLNTANVTVYPNPTTNDHSVTIRAEKGLKLVAVVDLSGRTVAGFGFENQTEGLINLTGVKAGTYILKVTLTDGASVIVKLVNN